MLLDMEMNPPGFRTLGAPPGLANGKPEQCQNAPVGPLKALFTIHSFGCL